MQSSTGNTTPRIPRAASPGEMPPHPAAAAAAAIEARGLVKTYPGPGRPASGRLTG